MVKKYFIYKKQKEKAITIRLVVIGMAVIGKSLLVLNFIDYNEKFHDSYEDEYNTNITIQIINFIILKLQIKEEKMII